MRCREGQLHLQSNGTADMSLSKSNPPQTGLFQSFNVEAADDIQKFWNVGMLLDTQ
jgi:hypothetical protein